MAQEIAAERTRLIDLPLLDFVPALTPSVMGDATEPPLHLKPIADVFERLMRGEQIRALVSVPPQYGKTFLLLHGIAQLIARRPYLPVIYASYGDAIARDKSRECRDYARRAGVRTRKDADAVSAWLTEAGGGMRARGVGGAIAGSPARLLVVDDPHKDRADAESALMRQRVHDWFTSTAMSRVHPGASVIVNSTRWHQDDLIGRLMNEKGPDGAPRWEVINLPAVLPDGRPLWHRRPLEFLEQHRSNEYDWHSLWMGQPRGKGNAVFRGVRFYDQLPVRYRVGKGLDLAYTSKTSACHSVGVTMLEDEGLYYVVDVRRAQTEVREFASILRTVPWPGAWHWFGSSTEMGVADLLEEIGILMNAVLATSDKFVRAQPVAAAWNEGRVLVPRNLLALHGAAAEPGDEHSEPAWLQPFVDEINAFTGVSDAANDQVDALASSFEAVRHTYVAPQTVPDAGTRYVGEEGEGRSFW